MKTKLDVRAALKRLLQSRVKPVVDWAKNKNQLWILAGLCRPFSLMDPLAFDSIQRISNVVESVHYKTQRRGVYLSLLGAIMRQASLQQVSNQSLTSQ